MLLRDKITQIFYDFDEYLKINFANIDNSFSLTNPLKMSFSEIGAIAIAYHQSTHKCFKFYYQEEILGNLISFFPSAISYERFVSIQHRVLPFLVAFLKTTRLCSPTDANYIDASKLEICHLMRVASNKVFKGQAKYGRTIMGRFYGYKFHLIINHLGEIVNVIFSKGNVADNNKKMLREITEDFTGLLIGDKGYITTIKDELLENGINLVTKPRKNMKPVKHTPQVEYYKKHRGLIETTNGLLKEKANIQHTRHRSTANFEINLWAAIIAYTYNEKLPSIKTYKKPIKPIFPISVAMELQRAA